MGSVSIELSTEDCGGMLYLLIKGLQILHLSEGYIHSLDKILELVKHGILTKRMIH